MKVLVVDENPRLREITGSVLQEAGLNVTGASAYSEAESLLQGRRFDAVVSELQEGWDSQVEFARRVAQRPRPALIVHTAWPGSVHTPLDLVARVRVTKRSDFAPLLDAVRSIVRGGAPGRGRPPRRRGSRPSPGRPGRR
jgi:CheY-like chemotaxis protein